MQRYLLAVGALLSAVLFGAALLKPREKIDLDQWARESCRFEQNRDLIDTDCRHQLSVALAMAQPFLSYKEKLRCFKSGDVVPPQISPLARAAPSLEATALDVNFCPRAPNWGQPRLLNEIGWDARAIWYGRAAMIYWQSQRSEWPGLISALLDTDFKRLGPNEEHWHYPWLLPVIYAQVMKVLKTPSPYPLVVLQIAIWVLSAFLFLALWPRAPRSLWLIFALAPIGGRFFYSLYADLWVLSGILLIGVALQKRRIALSFAATLATLLLKQEAWMQVAVFLSTYFILHRRDFQLRRPMVAAVAGFSLGLLILQKLFLAVGSSTFYVSLAQRFSESATYTELLPKFVGYYLDILLRPTLWGLLWPIFFFSVYRARRHLGWSLAPLAALLVVIPLAFLRFPFGHKEVFLTGANRALWQSLPTLWILMHAAFGNSTTVKTFEAKINRSANAGAHRASKRS